MQSIMENYYILIVAWCIILSSLTVFVPLKMRKTQDKRKETTNIFLFLCCVVILVADIVSVVFMGHAGNKNRYIVKSANYIEYVARYVYFAVFACFLQSIARDGSKTWMSVVLSVVNSGLGILLMTLSQVRGRFYYFDNENFFHYNNQYKTVQISFLISVLLLLGILVYHRKSYRKHTFFSFLLYFVILIGVMVGEFYLPTWDIQNITIFFSTQFIFLNDLLVISDKYIEEREEKLLLEYRANYDMMTDLWSKKSGLEKMEQYLEEMTAMDTTALIFLDIDNFKSINDVYGHETGDYWIEEVAELLKNTWESPDITCRYGGDEFIVFARLYKNAANLEQKIKRFQEELSRKAAEHQQEVHCSIGVCQIMGKGKKLQQCIQCADEALYRVKENGKNGYHIYQLR